MVGVDLEGVVGWGGGIVCHGEGGQWGEGVIRVEDECVTVEGSRVMGVFLRQTGWKVWGGGGRDV